MGKEMIIMPRINDEDFLEYLKEVLYNSCKPFITPSEFRFALEEYFGVKYSPLNMDYFAKKMRRCVENSSEVTFLWVGNIPVFYFVNFREGFKDE